MFFPEENVCIVLKLIYSQVDAVLFISSIKIVIPPHSLVYFIYIFCMLKHLPYFVCTSTCFSCGNSVLGQWNERKFGILMILFLILTTRGDTLLSRLCIPVCDLKSCMGAPVKLSELQPFMTVIKLL